MMVITMELKEKAKNLTTAPGVYLMRDSLGNVIYVGKAKNLRNRVLTYFQNSRNISPKVEKLIMNLKDFDHIVTETEFEAFILECKLIKELKPMYNRLMKSPSSYTYISIKIDETYPSLGISNSLDETNGNIYFGPYRNKNTVERALQGIRDCYKILCSNVMKKNSTCLNYSLGLCVGMCVNDSAHDYYRDVIRNIISFLNGNDVSLLEDMEQKMKEASQRLDFETAAKYRDYIKCIKVLINNEETIKFIKNNNILFIEPIEKNVVKIFLVKGSKILFSKKYILDSTEIKKICTIIKKYIIKYFGNSIFSPEINITKEEIDEAHIIFNYLKSRSKHYTIIHQDWLEEKNNFQMDEVIDRLLQHICS